MRGGIGEKKWASARRPKDAEREGFEPSVPLRILILSRDAPSAAQPPSQRGGDMAPLFGKIIAF